MRRITLLLLVVVVLFLSGCVDLPREDEQVDNTKPVSDAGTGQTVVVKQTIEFDGGGSSDADGDTLTYIWSITSAPGGSTAGLSDTTIVNPTFIPDVAGEYTIQLVVNDGVEDSDADSVFVIAQTPNNSNTWNVFWCSFQQDSTIELVSGRSYWIRMSIGFEEGNGYDDAVGDYENISFSVTLDGYELELYENTKIEYNQWAGFWEINGYYHTEVLEKGIYEIIGTSYNSGTYVDSATFFIIVV